MFTKGQRGRPVCSRQPWRYRICPNGLALAIIVVLQMAVGATATDGALASTPAVEPALAKQEDKTLQITFERSGGFAGMRLSTTVDTASLSEKEAQTLRQLLEEADFFNLPAQMVSRSPQPDRFQYTVTVEEDGRQHTVTISEEVMPAKLRPLIKWLMDAVRAGR